MDALLWAGVVLAAAGLGGVAWCLLEALRVKRGGLAPAEARRVLVRLQAVNLAAVATAFLGLAAVAAAAILG